MRVSYEWLKTLVDGPSSPEDLVAEFVRTGTEVESVERTGEMYDHIYVGQVVSKEPHPDSDHMSVCMVDVGEANLVDGKCEPLQIVCGATNFHQGDKIVVAMVGAEFGDFKIKKSKLRGVVSNGMNCSEKELGLASESNGIMILPEDAPVGIPFAEYYGLADTILDCEITPNRPDCLSMLGIATEVSAIYGTDVEFDLPEVKSTLETSIEDEVDVEVESPEICQRYVAAVAHNVKVGPSPEWLAKRVVACGARSINNVVDITNYVMYLCGQPLHAFDLNKLSKVDGKAQLVVRCAHDGETLTTLDGEERTLTSEMIVITDHGDTPVALAGVMGGANTEVDENTTDIVLESACFTPGLVSRASRNLNLISESSIRFERQVDIEGCGMAAYIALALLQECAGADIVEEFVDVLTVEPEVIDIPFRPEHARTLIGADISCETMINYLDHLGCEVYYTLGNSEDECDCENDCNCGHEHGDCDCHDGACECDEDVCDCNDDSCDCHDEDTCECEEHCDCDCHDDTCDCDNTCDCGSHHEHCDCGCHEEIDFDFDRKEYTVIPPSFRPDLTREIDLIEEIVRLWGMDRVEPTLPAARNHTGGLTVNQKRMRLIRSTLRSCGLSETTNYCFADAADLSALNMSEEGRGQAVRIINPLVSDQSEMRRSLIPGLLRSVAYNLSHGTPDVTLFELGRVFFGDAQSSQPEEPEMVAGVLCGKWQQDSWNLKEEPLDFFDAKGVIEQLLSALRIQKVAYKQADPEHYTWLQPGRAAEIVVRGKTLGWVGNIHPLSLGHFDIDVDVVAFELSLEALLERAIDQLPYTDIPALPGVEVDLALVVDEDVSFEMVSQRLKSAGGKLLESVELFDVYRDPIRVGHNKKSLAFKLVYRDPNKTLTAKAVEKTHAKLVEKICKSTGGEVRA